MEVFFGEELIDTCQSKKYEKLIFVSDLKSFVFNNRRTIHFDTAFRGNDFYEAVAGTTLYRQIVGIGNAEELRLLREALSIGKKRKVSWTNLQINITRCAYQMYRHRYKLPTDKYGIYDKGLKDLDLFMALKSCLRTGYYFNNTNPRLIYKKVHSVDVNRMFTAIMMTRRLPYDYKKVAGDEFIKALNNKRNFFAKLHIEFRRGHTYLNNFDGYNPDAKTLDGYFNNVDLEFFKTFGVKTVSMFEDYFWLIDCKPLKEQYITAYNALKAACHDVYKLDKKKKKVGLSPEEKWLRKELKNFCEYCYGSCTRLHDYETTWEWDADKQDFKYGFEKPTDVELDWYEVMKHNQKRVWQYGWGVWTCSYARLLLRLQEKELGKDALYGDQDSCKFVGDHFDLFDIGEKVGQWKDEGVLLRARFLELKRYGYLEAATNEYDYKFSGGDIETLKKHWGSCEDPLMAMSTSFFPEGVNPFKSVRYIGEHTVERWFGEVYPEKNYTDNLNIIICCAGGGKTTTLVKKIKELLDASVKEPIIVLTYTVEMANELKKRLRMREQDFIGTLDSFARRIIVSCDGQYSNEYDDKRREATEILRSDICDMAVIPSHLFVDEIQDVDVDKLNFLNSIPAVSRTYVGDFNQSIYGYDGALNFLEKFQRDKYKIERRNTNYRTPQRINDFAEAFLEEEYRPHAKCINQGGIINILTELNVSGYDVILCRNNREVAALKKKFPFANIMTIHKSKGLEWDKVLVINMARSKPTGEELRIAYVACTRARKELGIYNGVIV